MEMSPAKPREEGECRNGGVASCANWPCLARANIIREIRVDSYGGGVRGDGGGGVDGHLGGDLLSLIG